MSVEENKAQVRRFFEELYAGGQLNLTAFDDLYAVDIVHHSLPPGFSGLEGVKQSLAPIAGATSDDQVNVSHLIGEGDYVVVRWEPEMTHTGELMGIPATGKRIKLSSIAIFRFAHGKVVEAWAESNLAAVMQQLQGDATA
jgi:predicted ester cyclase